MPWTIVKLPGGNFTVRIFITKLSFRHSETSILTVKRGLRTWGFNFSIDNPLSVFSSSRGPKSNQDSCLMNVAVVFNNSRGFSHRHWNDLTYRNIFRFTFMELFEVRQLKLVMNQLGYLAGTTCWWMAWEVWGDVWGATWQTWWLSLIEAQQKCCFHHPDSTIIIPNIPFGFQNFWMAVISQQQVLNMLKTH